MPKTGGINQTELAELCGRMNPRGVLKTPRRDSGNPDDSPVGFLKTRQTNKIGVSETLISERIGIPKTPIIPSQEPSSE
jgi:hypothetical protein